MERKQYICQSSDLTTNHTNIHIFDALLYHPPNYQLPIDAHTRTHTHNPIKSIAFEDLHRDCYLSSIIIWLYKSNRRYLCIHDTNHLYEFCMKQILVIDCDLVAQKNLILTNKLEHHWQSSLRK